jgi:peptide-methionine (S)-S-oxide reductase
MLLMVVAGFCLTVPVSGFSTTKIGGFQRLREDRPLLDNINNLIVEQQRGRVARTRLAALFGENKPDGDDESKTPGLPFALPSVSQILSLWITGVSANRVIQSLSSLQSIAGDGGSIDTKIALNVALNGAIFVGASYFLLKTIQGMDYSSLEDLDQKSLAKQAGVWALTGEVPTNCIVNDKTYQVACFTGGCFWGTELHFQRIPGVLATCVGYTQGSVDKPTYEQVCSGSTGHTEGIQLIYDPSKCSYERLLNQLFDTINPTLLNRVGNDSGSQYRHGVYTHTEEQVSAASAVFESLQGKYQGAVVTELKPASVFWPAENYHQRYLEKRGQSAEKNSEEKVRCYG